MDNYFAGRQRERERLWAEFQKARDGQTTAVVISGEPGIGKTRLWDQVAQQAAQEGALILHGTASEMAGMPPYLPLLEALGTYVESAPADQLQVQIASTAPVLRALFPEIERRLGPLPAAPALPAEQARYRLYEALAGFLVRLAESQPVLLWLDDLQWADAASFDFLLYLMQRRPRARLLIGATLRSGEGVWDAVGHWLAELERLRRVSVIELVRLAPADVAALAEHVLDGPLDERTAQILAARSEGNPFFAEELLRDWLEMSRLARGATGWRLLAVADDEFPPSVLRAVDARLARLPAQTVEILRSAAVIGRQFEISLLAEALGQDADGLEALLQPAESAHLVRPTPGGFVFNHDLVRSVLYEQVPALRRQRIHGFVGRALETRLRPDTPHLSNLAFHFAHSADRERGIRYAQAAAAQAQAAYAPQEAVRHYQTALALLDQMVQTGLNAPALRGDLLLGLGETALQGSREHDAIQAFASALDWFREHGDRRAAARAAHGLGRARWQIENVPAAEEAFKLALQQLEDDAGALAARVHGDLANLLVLSRHQYERGMAHAQTALDIATRLGDGRLAAEALRTLGNLEVRANHGATGIARLDEALELSLHHKDLAAAADTCTGLMMSLAWHCRLTRASQVALQLIDLAEACQARYYLRHVYTLLYFMHIAQGNLPAAQDMLEQAAGVVEQLASPEPLAFLRQSQSLGAYFMGDGAAQDALMTEALATYRSLGPEALIWYLGLYALARLNNGRVDDARAGRAELEVLLGSMPPQAFPAAEAFAHLTLIALALGERVRLRELYPKLLPFRGQYHDALVDRLLGAIEIVNADWVAAQASLDAAEEVARRERLRWELAQTLLARADLELARGGPGSARRARGSLAEALEIFKAYGNAREVKQVRVRLRDLPRQPGQKAAPAAPAGLSQRELEVLRLLAQGQSNREIAATLALSEKTVANHITTIFNKIGVDNRAAAAAYAVREGLA